MSISTSAQYQRALAHASDDFDEVDPVRRAFVNIVTFIGNNQNENLNHLTFGMLREAAQLESDDGEILHRAIAYLTGARAKILELKYEFIGDEYEHELVADEVNTFLNEEVFHDPRTGMPVSECANHIYVFFRPNYAAFH